MSELLKRILFAVPAGAGFIAVVWLGGYYFGMLLLLLMLLGQYEMQRLATNAGMPVNTAFIYLFGLWTFVLFIESTVLWGGPILLGIFIGYEIFAADNDQISRSANTFFWGIYGPLGFAMLFWVRELGRNLEGFALALCFLLMIWCNDILAYFGGKYTGKHSMAPDISPNKTWEGFIFGIAGAFIGLFLTMWITAPNFPLNWIEALPLALISGVFGPIGDLIQSRIKRVADVKDASTIFPGHGGVWDRFDALVLSSIMMAGYLAILRIFIKGISL